MGEKVTRTQQLIEDVAKLDIDAKCKLYLIFRESKFIQDGRFPKDKDLIQYMNVSAPTFYRAKKFLKSKNMIY